LGNNLFTFGSVCVVGDVRPINTVTYHFYYVTILFGMILSTGVCVIHVKLGASVSMSDEDRSLDVSFPSYI